MEHTSKSQGVSVQISAGSPVLDLGGPSQNGISQVTNNVLRPRSPRSRDAAGPRFACKRQPRARARLGRGETGDRP